MFRKSLLLLACAGLISACASGPKVRSDFDRSANFAAYQTYGFVSPLGTDRRGNSTIISGHFKTAISREMEARGYRLATANPDLLVNVNVSTREPHRRAEHAFGLDGRGLLRLPRRHVWRLAHVLPTMSPPPTTRWARETSTSWMLRASSWCGKALPKRA